MPWIGAIGAAVVGAFGVGIAATTFTAMVVGGIVVGAAVGALYSAVTGGNILKGVLYGAIGGAVLGAGGYALGLGGTAVGAGPGAGQAGIGSSMVAGNQTTAAVLGTTTSTTTSTTTGAALFTKDGIATAGAAMSLGAAFLHGGTTVDPDAELAQREKELAENARQADQANTTRLKEAGAALDASRERTESAERIANAQLAENAKQFKETIGFEKYTYEDEKEETKAGKERFEQGISDAASYVRGNTKTASVVETSRQRRDLPSPIWYQDQENSSQQQQQSPGILAGEAA